MLCGPAGRGTNSFVAKPALRNIALYSENGYASPPVVVPSIIRLKAAVAGGVTRSSLGMKPRVTARPPGFSAP